MSNNNITVWGNGTTRTVRVLWMALELGLDYQHYPIGSRTGETQTEAYRKLNAREKIPTLVHDSLVLTESAAILNYMANVFTPPADFLVPDDPVTQAKLDEWCYCIMTELDAHALYLVRRHGELPHLYGEAPAAVASAKAYFLKQANALAEPVDKAGHYLMGEKFSVADIIMTSVIYWAKLYDIQLPQAFLDYHLRIAKRPTYQQVMRINYPSWFTEDGLIPKSLQDTLSR